MARGSIVKRPSGNYAIVYYVGTKQKWRTIGPVKSEAERALRDVMTRIDRSQYADLQKIGFEDFAKLWLRDYASLSVRPKTLKDYESIIRNHLSSEFENRALTSIQPAEVREVIARLAERRSSKTARGLVKREFHPALTRAGLQRIRFHDLRHSYATLLINQGENIKYVSSQLGHASTQITVDRYGHLLPEVHNGAGERLEKTLFGEKDLSNPLAACEISTFST